MERVNKVTICFMNVATVAVLIENICFEIYFQHNFHYF
jgi:hypothetical protein